MSPLYNNEISGCPLTRNWEFRPGFGKYHLNCKFERASCLHELFELSAVGEIAKQTASITHARGRSTTVGLMVGCVSDANHIETIPRCWLISSERRRRTLKLGCRCRFSTAEPAIAPCCIGGLVFYGFLLIMFFVWIYTNHRLSGQTFH